LSISLAKKGDWDATIHFSNRAIQIDPNYAKAFNQLGLAYYCKEQLEDAIKHYQRAIEIDSSYANAYNNLGYAYQKANQYPDAIRMFEAYLSKGPETDEASEIREHIELLRKKMLE
jgi:tetratricopeptide (TPR) repeat protein